MFQIRKALKKPHEAGLTLVELLVVMVILVLVAGLVAPRVIGYLGSSKTKTAKVQIESLRSALELYKLDVGRYPTSQEGLSVLVKKPDNATIWNGPYLTKTSVPEDPWGVPYHYRQPGQHGTFDIYTLGSDQREGGDKEASDVGSW